MNHGRPPGEPSIVFDGAGKCFDDTWVLRDVDLQVEPGMILGLIGPSGSGKTTTVRLMTGAYRADEGEVRVLGHEPTRRPRRERTDIGYLPQHPVLFDELSLWENLNFHASLAGVPFRRTARLRELLELVDLNGQEKKLVGASSGGMKRRLALAATLVHDPALLVLDEPTAGIDPILRRRFWEHFHDLASGGTSLVVSTQYVDEAALCDVVAVLAEGRVHAVGTPVELRRRAFGGDLVEVEFERAVGAPFLTRLRDVSGVLDARLVADTRVRLTIDPEDSPVPTLSERVAADDPVVVSTAEVAADWNEVFIELVTEARAPA